MLSHYLQTCGNGWNTEYRPMSSYNYIVETTYEICTQYEFVTILVVECLSTGPC